MVSTRPAISLGELMTENQLLHLVRLAVWNDQHRASWGGPWASHAICCLLQDVLEGFRMFPCQEMMSSELSASGPVDVDIPAETSTSSAQIAEEDFVIEDVPDSSVAGN